MKNLIIVALALVCGCVNIIEHTDNPRGAVPYAGTCGCCETIKGAFVTPKGPEGGMEQAYCQLFLPVTIVDLPLEVVADTVTLPYDTYAVLTKEGVK